MSNATRALRTRQAASLGLDTSNLGRATMAAGGMATHPENYDITAGQLRTARALANWGAGGSN